MDNFCWIAYGQAHAEMARQSFDTVRKYHPESKTWIVAENFTELPMMTQVVRDQAMVLNQIPEGETVCFLDNDALLRKPLTVGDDEFDVGVTWRDNMGHLSMLMPYNYGVVFARKNFNTMASWFWMTQHITRQTQKNQNWYGNQVALRELCGPINKTTDIVIRDHGYFKLKVAHYPCETHNWTPEGIEDPGDRYIVHCKGNRKDLLDHYYKEIMEAA